MAWLSPGFAGFPAAARKGPVCQSCSQHSKGRPTELCRAAFVISDVCRNTSVLRHVAVEESDRLGPGHHGIRAEEGARGVGADGDAAVRRPCYR